MNKKRKGAITMTEVLTNVENIMEQYEDKSYQEINKITRIEFILTVYKIKKIIKSDFAQRIIKENIIRDKTINEGRYTIKGTRITPEDIGRIITKEKVTVEEIYEEYPSLDKDEQILAGLFIYMKDIFTWRKVLFS